MPLTTIHIPLEVYNEGIHNDRPLCYDTWKASLPRQWPVCAVVVYACMQSEGMHNDPPWKKAFVAILGKRVFPELTGTLL